MDDNHKTVDSNLNPGPPPLMEAEKTAKEVGGEVDSSMWANWSAPKEKAVGFKSHESKTVTADEASSLNAPRRRAVTGEDFRRAVGRATVKVGEMEAPPKGIDYSGLTTSDVDFARQRGLDMRDPDDVKHLRALLKARTDY